MKMSYMTDLQGKGGISTCLFCNIWVQLPVIKAIQDDDRGRDGISKFREDSKGEKKKQGTWHKVPV